MLCVYQLTAPRPTYFSFSYNYIISLTNFLETLDINLGCFPFDYRPYHLKSDYFYCIIKGAVNRRQILSHIPVIQPHYTYTFYNKMLYLNIFHEKPAISNFDLSFSANRVFSQHFSTDTGAAILAYTQLGQLVSGLINLILSYKLAFTSLI